MDDIVVIILTLIVAVFGILNKSRKKNGTSAEKASSGQKASDFWDLLTDDNEDLPYEPEPEMQTQGEMQEPLKEARPKFQPSSEAINPKPIQKDMKRGEKIRKRKLIMGEEFSLKKAVIYSEIINRKYI